MIDLQEGVESLSAFTQKTTEILRRLRETGQPLVLTTDGAAQIVVQDIAAYQRLQERVTRAEREAEIAAIREGLADVDAGRTTPLKQAFQEIARELSLQDPTR